MGSIRDEIKQKRPFAGPADEAVVTLLRTADHVRVELSGVVERHDVTLQQYNVLRILRGAGEDGLPTLEIAARMIEASPGITRLLDRLESKGLVQRKRCPKDRRQVLCYASERALLVLSGLDAPMAAAADLALGRLDERRTRQLVRLLDAVRSGGSTPGSRPRNQSRNSRRPKKETSR